MDYKLRLVNRKGILLIAFLFFTILISGVIIFRQTHVQKNIMLSVSLGLYFLFISFFILGVKKLRFLFSKDILISITDSEYKVVNALDEKELFSYRWSDIKSFKLYLTRQQVVNIIIILNSGRYSERGFWIPEIYKGNLTSEDIFDSVRSSFINAIRKFNKVNEPAHKAILPFKGIASSTFGSCLLYLYIIVLPLLIYKGFSSVNSKNYWLASVMLSFIILTTISKRSQEEKSYRQILPDILPN